MGCVQGYHEARKPIKEAALPEIAVGEQQERAQEHRLPVVARALGALDGDRVAAAAGDDARGTGIQDLLDLRAAGDQDGRGQEAQAAASSRPSASTRRPSLPNSTTNSVITSSPSPDRPTCYAQVTDRHNPKEDTRFRRHR